MPHRAAPGALPDAFFAVTATTRERRPGEIDGVHYFFLNEGDFRERLADGEFLESATVYGNLYGVLKGPVRAALARGQDVFVKVDVQGAAEIERIVPSAVSSLPVARVGVDAAAAAQAS